jgi:hypothetical protein
MMTTRACDGSAIRSFPLVVTHVTLGDALISTL